MAHIHELMPEAKLIFMMRNPIERAWSQAVMSFDKAEKGSAESATEEELLQSFGRNSARLLTEYLRTLENWSAFYPEEQIFVGFLEDVSLRPAELLRSVYDFLGVDPYFEPLVIEQEDPLPLLGHDAYQPGCLPGAGVQGGDRAPRRYFGGYALFWSYSARRLIEDPPKEERTYPSSSRPCGKSGLVVLLRCGSELRNRRTSGRQVAG